MYSVITCTFTRQRSLPLQLRMSSTSSPREDTSKITMFFPINLGCKLKATWLTSSIESRLSLLTCPEALEKAIFSSWHYLMIKWIAIVLILFSNRRGFLFVLLLRWLYSVFLKCEMLLTYFNLNYINTRRPHCNFTSDSWPIFHRQVCRTIPKLH